MRLLSKSLTLFFILFTALVFGQDNFQVIDKIVAVVGEKVILKSELEIEFQNYVEAGYDVTENSRCEILEELLFQSLMLNQAELDSIIVSEDQVNGELDRRMRYFISQFGSEAKLEKFYQKSIPEIRNEFYEPVKKQLTIQQMQSTISQNVKITPAEVKEYYNSIPEDSLPYINAEVEVAQITKHPDFSNEVKDAVKKKLLGFKERVEKGENFGTLAILYSEDPGSAGNNGELGFMTRGMLVPEFAAVAFNLEEGEVSEIVETKFGFHIIQLLEKRGQEINARHILLKPKVNSEDWLAAKTYLDSVRNLIETIDTLSFEEAATIYSDDEDTKNNGGLVLNPMTASTKFEMDQLSQVDPGLFFAINKMKPGEMSNAELTTLSSGNRAYRIVKLISMTEPHKANLTQDYQMIQNIALSEKQNKKTLEWVSKKSSTFYVKVEDDFNSCTFRNKWPIN